MVKKIMAAATLRIRVITKVVDGKEIIGNINYSGISKDISDADFMALGEAIGSLQKYTLRDVVRIDNATLVEE